MMLLLLLLASYVLCSNGFLSVPYTVRRQGIARHSNQLQMLSISEFTDKWKIITFAATSKESFYGLESRDKEYYIQTLTAELSSIGGLGLDLIETQVSTENNAGLVLVGGVNPGSNAANCGLFQEGDALSTISTEGKEESLEGLNFDATVKKLVKFKDLPSVKIVFKRLLKRAEVIVKVVGPTGEEVGEYPVLAGYGFNLRTALQSNNIKMYDSRTARFDSPYQTGNCGGDGTCGTCVVAVLEGK